MKRSIYHHPIAIRYERNKVQCSNFTIIKIASSPRSANETPRNDAVIKPNLLLVG